jgi:hypothetical protein
MCTRDYWVSTRTACRKWWVVEGIGMSTIREFQILREKNCMRGCLGLQIIPDIYGGPLTNQRGI